MWYESIICNIRSTYSLCSIPLSHTLIKMFETIGMNGKRCRGVLPKWKCYSFFLQLLFLFRRAIHSSKKIHSKNVKTVLK